MRCFESGHPGYTLGMPYAWLGAPSSCVFLYDRARDTRDTHKARATEQCQQTSGSCPNAISRPANAGRYGLLALAALTCLLGMAGDPPGCGYDVPIARDTDMISLGPTLRVVCGAVESSQYV